MIYSTLAAAFPYAHNANTPKKDDFAADGYDEHAPQITGNTSIRPYRPEEFLHASRPGVANQVTTQDDGLTPMPKLIEAGNMLDLSR